MPFNMFKAFGTSSSRNPNNHRPDRAVYNDYENGFPKPDHHESIPPPQLRRHDTLTRKRMEPVFTPVPSRAPTDGDEYYDGYVRVDNPQTILGGSLNARPTRPEDGASRADSFSHGSVSGRHMPDDPVITQIHRSDDSGSDHTVEALRTPMSSYSNARVASVHTPGNYPGKTPTNIYGDGHEIRPMRHEEIHPGGRAPHSGSHGPIYYIIPGGVSVIFQDEYGNEVARVGDFSGRPAPRPAPFIVQDKHGREIYRIDYSYEGLDHERPYRPRDPRMVMMDPNQHSSKRPRGYSSQNYHSDPYRHYDDYSSQKYHSDPSYRHHDNYSSHRYHSDPSYRHHDDYYHENRGRGYRDRDYRDRDYRDPYRDREYRDKEYRDKEYRDKEYRDKEYRDREYRTRDHRDRHPRDKGHRGRDDWQPEDQPRGSQPPTHRSNSHRSHASSSRSERQFSQ
ncbi:hypothetical protein DEU56DRAFT_753623 [Suillus clintonianus]|uniref:uncharacterized protein n=1 Tax=Suillus clintonianus TaxID=1904413 RepID=UPI001B884FD3|nr:uncharacterized protein DEU56DRAFT_753623 [Suillus clintonianus]KAG2146744.1 hypothetical protein DEU56DRAFT_753623 [Suillus clintonianus]